MRKNPGGRWTNTFVAITAVATTVAVASCSSSNHAGNDVADGGGTVDVTGNTDGAVSTGTVGAEDGGGSAPDAADAGIFRGPEAGAVVTPPACGSVAVGPCPNGGMCMLPSDCTSDVCTAGVCSAPATTCSNGRKDGDESDVDCGGASCPSCGAGKMCSAPTDCMSVMCTGNVCVVPTPTDGIRNDSETDVDCGGALLASGAANPASDGAPGCADEHACALDTDCLSRFCSTISHTCVDGQSCKGLVTPAPILDPTGTLAANGEPIGTPDPNGLGQSAGIDTCGVGESTDPVATQKHESCCRSLLMPGSTTLRMDKYEATSGRVRQFLESLNYDVRGWAMAQFDANLTPTTDAGRMLMAQLPINQSGVVTNVLTLLPHSDDVTEPLNAVILTGALVMDQYGLQGCYTGQKEGGAATYWWDADKLASQAKSPPRPFTQDFYDIKPMNCIPYYLAAAFCAWDGGRLPTNAENKAIWGTATHPWGSKSPPVLFVAGETPQQFLKKAAAAGLPITGYTANWHNSNLGDSTGEGDFYFYPSYPASIPNNHVPDTLTNTLDLSPYISPPGRFYVDATTAVSPSFGGKESWQDVGADMMEWAGLTKFTGTGKLCDESGILAPGEKTNCACGGAGCTHATSGINGVIRATGLPDADLLGGSWEGHTIEQTQKAGWSFYRQYGKTGLRCVRPAEPTH